MVEALFAVNEGSADLAWCRSRTRSRAPSTPRSTRWPSTSTCGSSASWSNRWRSTCSPCERSLRGHQVGPFDSGGHRAAGRLRSNLERSSTSRPTSTAEAAGHRGECEVDPTAAAIGNRRAAEVYGRGVGARRMRITRRTTPGFVVVGRDAVPGPTGHDKIFDPLRLPARRPARITAGNPPGVRGQGYQPRPPCCRARPRRTSAITAFLVDPRGLRRRRGRRRPPRHAQGDMQADVKFPGSYPAAGSDGPSRRAEFGAKANEACEWVRSIRGFVERDWSRTRVFGRRPATCAGHDGTLRPGWPRPRGRQASRPDCDPMSRP